MKKILALVFALASGFYLLALGWLPDPLPFVEEGVALLIFLNCLAYLGFDLRGFWSRTPQSVPVRAQRVD